ncbi:hypothetical protein VCRA2121O264_330012 [Vibrio crassostreae]|nr:hypothetical protein VCRA2121O264_330012 [Vibrio crassostreae]CAK3574901.1 hypothetical protein VCRA2121O262_340012 [Vibrio crassostreae]
MQNFQSSKEREAKASEANKLYDDRLKSSLQTECHILALKG